MRSKVYSLLNIKPSEYSIVKQLFLVQLLLGIATAFLFTCTLTFFLHTFNTSYIPKVYLYTAALLLIANWVYSKLEKSYSSRALLRVVILFSGCSLVVTWVGVTLLNYKWLPFLLSGWNLVVFMLVGYAFWGMAAMIFNVRESKRIFSLVGAGDLPAKLLGYALVPVLIPYVGVTNLLWCSVVAFAGAYIFLQRLQHPTIDTKQKHKATSAANTTDKSLLLQLFHNELIFYIALFSLVAFTIYALIDYTLLVEIKSRFTNSPDLAIFIGLFFAVGRVLAIFVKVLLSSRVISNFGLANSLLISPVVLLLITMLLFIPGESERAVLYTFGIMVLCSEILKSVVQEPAFFILFQPLEPHVRLKGHLLAKGYMLPFALGATGLLLILHKTISIQFIGQVLVVLLVVWAVTVFLVKKAYLRTLLHSIKNGWFNGAGLFLNDAAVRQLLLRKAQSNNPKEIVMALELLDRSGYKDIDALLLGYLKHATIEVRKYVLTMLLQRKNLQALPAIVAQLQHTDHDKLRPELLKAYYNLKQELTTIDKEALLTLQEDERRAAFAGLLMRGEGNTDALVLQELNALAQLRRSPADEQFVLDVVEESPSLLFLPLLQSLLTASSVAICKRAIEVAGKVQAHELLEQVIITTIACKAYHALQRSITNYGDDVFENELLQPEKLTPEVLKAIVLAAGRVKGPASMAYLLRLMQQKYHAPGAIVDAMWQKQASLPTQGRELISTWLNTKLSSSHRKVKAFKAVAIVPELHLLSNALRSELKQDVQKLLKGLALCYDRERIDRVSKLLQIGDTSKVANAIETLEHTLPKSLFKQVDKLLDFVLDETNYSQLQQPLSNDQVPAMLAHIMANEHLNCTTWTRAVACYLSPLFATPALRAQLANAGTMPEDTLLQETREYVLSELS